MSILLFLLGAGFVAGLVWIRSRKADFLAQSPSDYANATLAFDLKSHLNGPILCEGIIYGPTGRVASRFVADFEASWVGDVGTMRESFRFDSGAVQERNWTISLAADGTFRAESDDLIGHGLGKQAGDSAFLKYRIKLSEAAGGHVLDVTDWMYLVENGTIINRSQFRKFGFKVGELVATMRRKDVK